MSDMTVANTILAQLGGRKFLAMTGAYSLTGSADTLSMRLPSKSTKNKVGGMRITLDPDDTYTLVAIKLTGSFAKGNSLPNSMASFSSLQCKSESLPSAVS